MKCSITGSQIFLSYVSSDVHVGLILDPIININWILEANPVFSLAIVLTVNHHGYKCLDLSTGCVYVSCHVIFDENMFPYQKNVSSILSSSSTHVTLPFHLPVPQPARFNDMQTQSIPSATNDSIPLVSHSAKTNEEPLVRHTTSISSPDIVAADQPISSSLSKTPLQPTLNPTVM